MRQRKQQDSKQKQTTKDTKDKANSSLIGTPLSLTSRLIKQAITVTFLPAYASYSTLKYAAGLPFIPISWGLKKVRPNLIDDINSKKRKIKNKIKKTADASIMTVSSLMAKFVLIMMTLYVSIIAASFLYGFVYYAIMPQDVQKRELSFYVSNQVETNISPDNNVVATPNLLSVVPIGNQKSGQIDSRGIQFDLFMEDEYYNIDIEFVVQETEQNFKNGNIFISTKLTSYKNNEDPIIFHRMGHIENKASLIIYLKQALTYIPLLGYLCNCGPSQTINIQIIENFNNFEFSANAIELILSNSSIVFSKASIIVKSSLFGIRYLMRNWFFTTAIFIISILTSLIFLTCLAFFIVLKQNIRKLLFTLNPATPKKRKPLMATTIKKKDFNFDVSEEPTDGQLSAGDDESSEDEDIFSSKSQTRGLAERVLMFLINAIIY